jgi:hypothetical protein
MDGGRLSRGQKVVGVFAMFAFVCSAFTNRIIQSHHIHNIYVCNVCSRYMFYLIGRYNQGSKSGDIKFRQTYKHGLGCAELCLSLKAFCADRCVCKPCKQSCKLDNTPYCRAMVASMVGLVLLVVWMVAGAARRQISRKFRYVENALNYTCEV